MSHTKKDTLDWLNGLQVHGIVLGLENITELLRRMGNPEKRFRSVHVAGSDGKGSVCACTASILRSSGFCTGLYTSPHLEEFNERISVDGEDITDDELASVVEKIRSEVEWMASHGMMCTFFEVTTALAFQYFADRDVDYAVVEVGMGGRFDATNVLVPKACAIGNISLEHTAFLGDTIEKIAFEKAGIIKSEVPCVTKNPEPAFTVIDNVAEDADAPLTRVIPEDIEVLRNGREGVEFTYKEEEYYVSIPGRHQASNASVAIETVSKLPEYGRCIRCNIRKGLSSVKWPCRMEHLRELPIIMDVTHTSAGAKDLASDISEIYGKVVLVFGVLEDKDIEHICEYLAHVALRVYVTRPESSRATDSAKVFEAMSRYHDDVIRTENVFEAMDKAVRELNKGETILVTGSFYMAGDVRTWLRRTYAKF